MSLPREFHTELQCRVHEWLTLQNIMALPDQRLPNGRFADLLGIDKQHHIIIVEVKTALKHSLIENACHKYRPYCNQLYIAAPVHEIGQLLTDPMLTLWPATRDKIGLLAVTDRQVVVAQRPTNRLLSDQALMYLKWQMDESRRFADARVSEIIEQ